MNKHSRRGFLAGSVVAGLAAMTRAVAGPRDITTTAWRNWSGTQMCQPVARFAPGSEFELMEFLKHNKAQIRPVGAGHSFSPLVPTNGRLLVLDKMSGLISHDTISKRATLAAGTRLSESGPLLAKADQAMFNLPDIDRQTLAGAISTSTHGTGKELKSLSGYVTGLRLITPGGELLELDENNDPDIFHAARVSLGCLGVITQITFQNRDPFRVMTRTWIEETEKVLEGFDGSANAYEHFEMMPLLHARYSLVIAHKETEAPLKSGPEADDGGEFLSLMDATPVMLRGQLIDTLASQIEPSEAVSESYDGLANLRFDRFNEMEYSVPLDAGAACLREILAVIEKDKIDAVIPLEYRIVKGDDTWLGMFSGAPRISISVHRLSRYDYRPLFDRVEPIFWKYEGRPHWGKVHQLGYEQLSSLYPRLNDFVRLQAELDPNGVMLNTHLKKIMGKS